MICENRNISLTALVAEKTKINKLMGLVPSEALFSVSKVKLLNPLERRDAVSMCSLQS